MVRTESVGGMRISREDREIAMDLLHVGSDLGTEEGLGKSCIHSFSLYF